MVTFRSPIWNSLIKFIESLIEFPGFAKYDDGRMTKRMQYLYDRALVRMRFEKSDFDLLTKSFLYLNEKDIDNDFAEYMNENEKLGYKCLTTEDGERIITEAEAEVKQRKKDTELQTKLDAAKKKFDDAEAKKNQYYAERDLILDEFEKAKMELDLIQSVADEEIPVNEKKETVKTNENEITESKDSDVIESDDSTGDSTEEAEVENE